MMEKSSMKWRPRASFAGNGVSNFVLTPSPLPQNSFRDAHSPSGFRPSRLILTGQLLLLCSASPQGPGRREDQPPCLRRPGASVEDDYVLPSYSVPGSPFTMMISACRPEVGSYIACATKGIVRMPGAETGASAGSNWQP